MNGVACGRMNNNNAHRYRLFAVRFCAHNDAMQDAHDVASYLLNDGAVVPGSYTHTHTEFSKRTSCFGWSETRREQKPTCRQADDDSDVDVDVDAVDEIGGEHRVLM